MNTLQRLVLLFMPILAGCDSKIRTTVKVPFSIAPLTAPVQIDDLRFFIHNVYLIDSRGNKLNFHFDSEQPATQGVALIDLRKNSNRHFVSGWVQSIATSFSGIEFVVGVPFQLNHTDPLTAPAPFNDMTMFWVWRDGYKFFRLDYQTDTDKPAYHLGSTGCQSPSPVRPPQQLCDQSNTIKITLHGFDPLVKGIKVNINALIAAMDNVENKRCTGNYAEDNACLEVYSQLGLDAQTGNCIDNCKSQTLFQ